MKGGNWGKGGIGGNSSAGAGVLGRGVRDGNVGKGGGGGSEERVGISGGGSEERVGISGAIMVVNNMNSKENMVEIFGFWSWRLRSVCSEIATKPCFL